MGVAHDDPVAHVRHDLRAVATVQRTRREWSASDAVVFCAAVGSGFRLGEHRARFHDGAGFANGLTSGDGWVIGVSGFVPAVVEYPWVVVGHWLPPGVVANSPIGPDGSAYNVIAIWSTLGGLAVALWTMAPRRPENPVLQRLMKEVIQAGERRIEFMVQDDPLYGDRTWVYSLEVDGQLYEATVSRRTDLPNFNHIVHFSPLKETP